MSGNNYFYRLGMPIAMEKMLKDRAKNEGLYLAELIRRVLYNWLKKEEKVDVLKRIETKVDKLLERD